MRYLFLIVILVLVLVAPVSAATEVVYPEGEVDVTIPASQFISVFTEGGSRAKVLKQVGYPNQPNRFVLETNGEVEDEETHFGAYTNATVVRIQAGTDKVYYSVGSGGVKVPVSKPSPRLLASAGTLAVGPGPTARAQAAPIAKTTAVTLTIAELLNGIITATHAAGATQAYTLPTGTLSDAGVTLNIDEGFEWSIINLSAAAADTVTVTAGAGHTVVGTMEVASAHATTGLIHGNAIRLFTRKTAANTFVTYRLR